MKRTFDNAAAVTAHGIDAMRTFLDEVIDLRWDHGYIMQHPDSPYTWEDLARTALAYGRKNIDPNMTASNWVPTLVSKQRDYGTQNILKFGLDGIVVRTWDKIARIENLEATQHVPDNESIADSVYDLVGYCILALMLINDEFELPLEET